MNLCVIALDEIGGTNFDIGTMLCTIERCTKNYIESFNNI